MPAIRLNAPKSFRGAIRRVVPLVGLIVSLGALGASSASASIGEWGIQSTLNPGSEQEFDNVGCNTSTLCMAVGTYSSGPLVEVWDGKEWSWVPSTTGAEKLNDAACIDNGECGAVGSKEGQAWGQKWTKFGGWKTMPVPSIGASSSEFNGSGCAPVEGKLECFGVGSYTSGSFRGTLAMRWETATQKFVYFSTPNVSQNNVLNDVSCNAVGSCVAVGYFVEFGNKYPLAIRWDGTSWSTEFLPSPEEEPAGTDTYLNDVSCSGSGAAARCVAVGVNEGGAPQTAVGMRWNGEEWLEAPPVEPAGLEGDFSFNGVSCLSASECYAAGEYATGEIETQTLIEEWDGSEWAVSPSPNPEGAERSWLNGIFCRPSSTDCLTVGSSEAAGQATLALLGK